MILSGPTIDERGPGTREALEIAARQFRQYETHHRQRAEDHYPGAEEKVETNRLMAEMCERAAAEVIEPPTPLQVVVTRATVTLVYDTLGEAEEAHREITKVFARRDGQQKDTEQ
jgi:hypothetical protein